jgi:hypothetical protein
MCPSGRRDEILPGCIPVAGEMKEFLDVSQWQTRDDIILDVFQRNNSEMVEFLDMSQR